MNEDSDKMNELLARLEALSKQQILFQQEIDELHIEINRLRSRLAAKKYFKQEGKPAVESKEPLEPVLQVKPVSEKEIYAEPVKPVEPGDEKKAHVELITEKETLELPVEKKVQPEGERFKPPSGIKSNLEEFIGGNLINKIGIIIIILGVGIGVKYAIDHDLISPLVRIILGYMVGFGLLGFALRLRKKYDNFSAVLLSGSMAIFYFISYAFHAYYELIPQWLAYALMVVITIVTVLAAIRYDRQVIAHIGLVGAYIVPFIFKETNSRPEIFFPYMAIINTGILVLAIKKYWVSLYYSSFLASWLIFASWFIMYYKSADHFALASVILPVFFITFYLVFLLHKLINKGKITFDDILVLLTNSFIFYGFGYYVLKNHATGQDYLGIFTLGNAVLHALISILIYTRKFPDRNFYYFISGLALVFITITIPVQLDGSWITLLWTGEAAVLFWIGRTKNEGVYEKLSYVVIFLAFVSLTNDWIKSFEFFNLLQQEISFTPIVNMNFFISALCIAIFISIYILHRNQKYLNIINKESTFFKMFTWIFPTFLIMALYFIFRFEIGNHFNQLYQNSNIDLTGIEGIPYNYKSGDYDIKCMRSIWLINYSMVFLAVLSMLNMWKLKSNELALFNIIFNALTILIFLALGLYLSGNLRDSYLNDTLGEFYHRSTFHILIRYISYFFAGSLLYISYRYINQKFIKTDFRILFDIFLHTTLLWIASSELIQWLDFAGSNESYKLELSILWGLYAVLLIILGIWKKKKHLRISAIVVFGATLLKLFVYDIAHLDTISKTIVFIVLGVLMLITSFLYIKYRKVLFGSPEEKS